MGAGGGFPLNLQGTCGNAALDVHAHSESDLKGMRSVQVGTYQVHETCFRKINYRLLPAVEPKSYRFFGWSQPLAYKPLFSFLINDQ